MVFLYGNRYNVGRPILQGASSHMSKPGKQCLRLSRISSTQHLKTDAQGGGLTEPDRQPHQHKYGNREKGGWMIKIRDMSPIFRLIGIPRGHTDSVSRREK